MKTVRRSSDTLLRVKVGQAIGRALKPSEEVHHKNRNRWDDRLENLMVLSRREHRKLHVVDRKYQGMREEFALKAASNNLQDILWSGLKSMDLSEIAA